ncbi:unnamed protein product [marine sediment metagenome]|uniref:Uncharacterized protein n=1 Tax=marine sediment metagenome TaxID=412755 RepID=X1AKT8_9ZZZZ
MYSKEKITDKNPIAATAIAKNQERESILKPRDRFKKGRE